MHVPVLLQEMLQAVRPRSGGIYLDGTVGPGGYAQAILEASEPDGMVVGLDLDPEAVALVSERLRKYGDRFKPVHGGFHQAGELLFSLGIQALDAAVLDLGLSSEQLEDPKRGFSFKVRGPLDMRFDTTSGLKAIDYLTTLSIPELEEILATYGEERYCKKLARGILHAQGAGRLNTTEDLANVVTGLLGPRRGKIHPATRTFQAVRIAVNRELDNLSVALDQLPLLLKPGGRFCVVSYHSLEDRLVKTSFRNRKRESRKWIVVSERPVRPSHAEVKANPRSRSARMRVLEAASCGDFHSHSGGEP